MLGCEGEHACVVDADDHMSSSSAWGRFAGRISGERRQSVSAGVSQLENERCTNVVQNEVLRQGLAWECGGPATDSAADVDSLTCTMSDRIER